MIGYCGECNAAIWIEYRFDGLAWVAEFYSTGNYERISHCLGCGQGLTKQNLVSERASAE